MAIRVLSDDEYLDSFSTQVSPVSPTTVGQEEERKSSTIRVLDDKEYQKSFDTFDATRSQEPVLVQTEQLLQKEKEEAPTEPQSMKS